MKTVRAISFFTGLISLVTMFGGCATSAHYAVNDTITLITLEEEFDFSSPRCQELHRQHEKEHQKLVDFHHTPVAKVFEKCSLHYFTSSLGRLPPGLSIEEENKWSKVANMNMLAVCDSNQDMHRAAEPLRKVYRQICQECPMTEAAQKLEWDICKD